MVESPVETVSVELVLNKEPNFPCYPPVKEFLDFLIKNVSGNALGSFGDVIISNVEPSVEDLNKLWIQTNGQRNDFQIKLYINGAWRPWTFTAPNETRWFDGRAPLPEGWASLGTINLASIAFEPSANSNAPTSLTLAKWVGY